MAVTAERRTEIIKQFRVHETDVGSPEVQVALLTEQIRQVTEHLKAHRHDFAGRRGLVCMVSRRNRLTDYLRRVDRKRYLSLIDRLGLRK